MISSEQIDISGIIHIIYIYIYKDIVDDIRYHSQENTQSGVISVLFR